MLLVVDANILIATLIKDSATRKLLMSEELILITPEFALEEINDHLLELAEKAKADQTALWQLLVEFIQKAEIKIYPAKEVQTKLKQALAVSPDPNDTMYFALALRENAAIWSNDKELKKQNKVKIVSTKELLGMIKITTRDTKTQ